VRPFALDTNTDVGFKRGEPACVELIRQARRLLISSTVLGELLAGFACGDQEARYREELRRSPATTPGSPPVARSMERCCSASMPISSACPVYGWCAPGRRCCDRGWQRDPG